MNIELSVTDLYEIRDLLEGAMLRDEAGTGYVRSPRRVRIIVALNHAIKLNRSQWDAQNGR